MKKQIAIKIIGGVIIFIFALFFLQGILPIQASAATKGLNWDNPNAKGDNPYKINTDAILNSQTMMQVVGCTGLVDKVTSVTTQFLKNQANKLIQKIWKDKAKAKAKNSSCSAVKAAIASALAGIPNVTYSTAIVAKIDCKDIQNVTDPDTTRAIEATDNNQDAAAKREECFNGLAYTLAKNQLASMTRQTVNWVNSGFNGNPMYVQNITNLTNSIERNVLETGTEILANGLFPYGGDFSELVVRSYNTGGTKYGAANFLNSLTSDLSAFITDDDSYFPTNTIQESRLREQRASNAFANDFSVGGWDGYLALTQRDQNNPLGFTMQASQYLADRIEQQSYETNNELLTNNGFLSQKKCVKWQLYDEATGKAQLKEVLGHSSQLAKKYEHVYGPSKISQFDKCAPDGYEVVTPGSIIKDKLTTYVNSPERQLELADTINKSLNSLFTSLIEKFRQEGLFGLSQEKYAYIDKNMGLGYGSTSYDENDSFASPNSGNDFNNIDLTRDLGNTYIHEDTHSLGNWNAKLNIPELNVGLGPYSETMCNGGYCSPNYYYTVSIAGNTKLMNNGYNGWAVNDRVFWDGEEWQNWKCGPVVNQTTQECSNQVNPIDERGIIQIQKDYVVAAKEILKILPGIMPKLGQLDYCIPGPSLYFESNSGDAAGALNEFAGSLQSIYKEGSFLKRDSTTYSLAQPGNTAYDEYKNIFDGTPYWSFVTQSFPWRSLQQLGAGITAKKDRAEGRLQTAVDTLINQIQNDIKTFYKDYNEKVFKGVYGTMRSEFKEREDTFNLIPNAGYVPMIEDGYNVTKDILSYNEDMITAVDDYKSAIMQAESNTQKLSMIKNQVSKIIKDAQVRRDTELVAQLGLTYDQYIAKYATCFKEEDILYYDDNDIIVDLGGDEKTRCHDGIDNDLDGLIDTKDPDCLLPPEPPTGDYNGYCYTVASGTYGEVENMECYSLETRETCTGEAASGCLWRPIGGLGDIGEDGQPL